MGKKLSAKMRAKLAILRRTANKNLSPSLPSLKSPMLTNVSPTSTNPMTPPKPPKAPKF